MEEDKTKRIVIELDDWDSVPTLYVDGEEIKYKVDINFSWRTKSDIDGGMKFHYKYWESMLNKTVIKTNTFDIERGIID